MHKTHEIDAIVYFSADEMIGCGSTNQNRNENGENHSPRYERPEQKPKGPEPDPIKWRKVYHAIVFPWITIRFGSSPVLHKQ